MVTFRVHLYAVLVQPSRMLSDGGHKERMPCMRASSLLARPSPGLSGEKLLSLHEAAQQVPKINGRRHAPSTLWRWCRQGLGGVRLEHVRIGRTIATSTQALDRFFAALAAAEDACSGEVGYHE